MNDPTAIYLGLDVGGTKIAGGLVAFPSARVIEFRTIPTRPERGGLAVLEDTMDLATGLASTAQQCNQRVAGVGIGICELVDRSGQVVSANSFDWRSAPIGTRLRALAPAVIEADVRAAALAEARFGAGSGYQQFLYVTVGTGISSCLVVNGQPFAGARGLTGTMASSPLPAADEPNRGMRMPTLEEVASGPAIVARYNHRTGAQRTSAADVVAAAGNGDSEAHEVMRSATTALGAQLGMLISTLDPAALIIGGGLGTSGGKYWDLLVEATRIHIYSDLQRALPILPAALGPDAGWIGAAAAAWMREEKPTCSQA